MYEKQIQTQLQTQTLKNGNGNGGYKIPAIVINLDTRTDRWQQIIQRFSNVNSIQLERFSAIKHSKGSTGCLLSHQSIVRYAKDNNYEMVLVLEDDCKVCNDFDLRFPTIVDWLITNKHCWDTFNGGPAFVKINNHYHSHYRYNHQTKILCRQLPIVMMSGLMCHFTIYNKSSYDTILSANHNCAIDEHINNNLRQVTSLPLLATQIPSQSNAQSGYKDYRNEFTKAQRKLTRFVSRN